MKLIEPTVRVIQQEPGELGMYKAAAEAAYISYQTNPETARLSPRDFIHKVIIPNRHNRVLEFATVYLEIPYWETAQENFREYGLVSFFQQNPWSKCMFITEPANPRWAVTTNFRVIVENALEEAVIQYSCEPTKYHAKRYTAEFICSRGAGDDFRTHVVLSSIMESSRYCNYSKDKFDNELTFIKPYWLDNNEEYEFALKAFQDEEYLYMRGALMGMQAQQLKRIFPLGCKTQLRMCGFAEAWNNFFDKRCDPHADPECQLLATKLQSIIYE